MNKTETGGSVARCVNRPRALWFAAALAPLLLALASCGSTGVITSLDDLTAHVDQEGLLSLQQQRALSLSGLMPSAPVGSIYRFDGDRSPFTAVGLSTVRDWGTEEADEDADADEKLTTKENEGTVSYMHQRTIECPLEVPELMVIRDKLSDVRVTAAKLIRLRVERLSKKPDDRASIDADIRTTQITFDMELRAANKMLSQPGLMVVRVESSSSGSWTASLGEILGLSEEQRNERAGFALLAGLRTSFLFVGSDLEERFDQLTRDWSLIGRRVPFVLGITWAWGWLPIPFPGQTGYEDTFIVTSQLEAQYILYAQDAVSERKIEADLNATLDQLDNLSALAKTEQLEIAAVLSSVESLGSMGVIGKVRERMVRLDDATVQYPRTDKRSDLALVTPDDDDDAKFAWTTVYAVLSEANDLSTLVSGDPRPHFASIF